LDQIVEQSLENGEERNSQVGFPCLSEVLEILISENVISRTELETLLKKHRDAKLPKLTFALTSPPHHKTKTNSPK
jgi:hypothetical protein